MVTIVVPCFNEEEVLPAFYRECVSALNQIGEDYELLFIDDGSVDNTLRMIKEFASRNNRIRYISFSRNFGKEAAIFAGLQHAKGEYVALMDADLQDPPSLLPSMYEKLRNGECDSVAAKRTNRKGESIIRSFFSCLFYKIIRRISNANIEEGARDYRMMKRAVVNAVLSICEKNRFSKGIFGWVGFTTEWIAYDNSERAAGKTKWSLRSLFRYAIDGIISFSSTPLYIASWSGVLMTLLSFVVLIIIIIRKLLFGDPVAGWASTICIILFIGGIQMFCMGIMGQYLAKTYLETKGRPIYIIAEMSNQENEVLK